LAAAAMKYIFVFVTAFTVKVYEPSFKSSTASNFELANVGSVPYTSPIERLSIASFVIPVKDTFTVAVRPSLEKLSASITAVGTGALDANPASTSDFSGAALLQATAAKASAATKTLLNIFFIIYSF